jgi:hypothetical protein
VAAQNESSKRDDRPTWLDQILGTASPPFTFRRGGSAVTGGVAESAQQRGCTTVDTNKGRQRG